TAPASQSPTKFGFPGSVPSISASGSNDGLVWVLEPTGNGRLHAYDASDLSKELFSASTGSYVKFSTPAIANGKVYAGTQNSLLVFGLKPGGPASISSIVNAASFQPGGVAPGSLISIFGTNLAGATVTINGTPATLLYTSPTQLNAQVPFEIAPGAATVMVNGSNAATLTIQAAAPGLFTLTGNQAAVVN